MTWVAFWSRQNNHMIQLQQLVPLNYQSEKEKFFQDFSYNPQFVYETEFPESIFLYYGKPEEKLVNIAQNIAKNHVPLYLLRLAMKERQPVLRDAQVESQTRAYLKALQIEERYTITFKPNAISRCSIRSREIIFRQGTDYTTVTLAGVLNHELGTHALRRINDETQPWFGQRKKLGFTNALVTEEGLAILHQQMTQAIPTLYSSAIRYLALQYALTHSFAELWHYLIPFIRNAEKRWLLCFRAKRGLTDTAKPGGFTKDLVYFSGAYHVSQWLVQNKCDLTRLYYGKINYTDVARAEALKPNKKILLPHFYLNNKTEYADKISLISTINGFTP